MSADPELSIVAPAHVEEQNLRALDARMRPCSSPERELVLVGSPVGLRAAREPLLANLGAALQSVCCLPTLLRSLELEEVGSEGER